MLLRRKRLLNSSGAKDVRLSASPRSVTRPKLTLKRQRRMQKRLREGEKRKWKSK